MRQYCQAAIEKQLTELLDALLSTGIELREPARVHVKAMELADELKQSAVYAALILHLYRRSTADCGPPTSVSTERPALDIPRYDGLVLLLMGKDRPHIGRHCG
jgi:hypothetical protein